MTEKLQEPPTPTPIWCLLTLSPTLETCLPPPWCKFKRSSENRGEFTSFVLTGLFFSFLISLPGIIHQMKAEYDAALKFHKAHLSLAQELSDYAAQGRAYGNMGNAYHALGVYDQAVRYHRQELQISLEVGCSAVRRGCGSSESWGGKTDPGCGPCR